MIYPVKSAIQRLNNRSLTSLSGSKWPQSSFRESQGAFLIAFTSITSPFCCHCTRYLSVMVSYSVSILRHRKRLFRLVMDFTSCFITCSLFIFRLVKSERSKCITRSAGYPLGVTVITQLQLQFLYQCNTLTWYMFFFSYLNPSSPRSSFGSDRTVIRRQ